ncbi:MULTISPECIES: superoxide dismutase family protein [Salinimicrobium]|jgi:Cu-Zn family superoxide dismutase|uniref:Superoxide dismutase [Cu-Zn] n=1 Tax=Salinimicrobium profundisediminis TaxID=2994553 RepID=A0A9X3CU08_9FLAO|nr:superoxide dismutase family protein [Salinimicrobium profundisediminis]MCX2836669.1 superoxide dismutase family protein [Salinimicrobium profundisediminis]
MKRIGISAVLAAALVLTSCKNENQTADERVDEHTNLTQQEEEAGPGDTYVQDELTLQMEPRSGSNVSGTITFVQENDEVTMTAELTGLEEGMHAIHLHENADCSAEDGTSAGGHWNPTFEDHGEWGDAGGYHRGDIGNFDVNSNGEGSVTFTTDEWCIGCDDEKKNILNKAVIVHAGVDDYTSQPSGNAGTRIGCAEIKM